MNTPVPHVGCRDKHIPWQLALDAKVPILHVWGPTAFGEPKQSQASRSIDKAGGKRCCWRYRDRVIVPLPKGGDIRSVRRNVKQPGKQTAILHCYLVVAEFVCTPGEVIQSITSHDHRL